MSDSHDQSYYEIALTNRQVLSIFVVLLVCVLLSFLGGVWLGRDADASVEMASTQSIVAGEARDVPLEALDFFNRLGATGKPDPAEGAAARDSGAASREEPALAPTRGAAEPERKPTRAERAEASEIAAPANGGPGPRSTEKEATPVPGSGAANAIPSAVVIQVFSSNEEAQALRVAERLRKSGYPAILSPVEVAGRTLHRVRIGPYSDSDEAQVVAESVRRAFKFDTWITH